LAKPEDQSIKDIDYLNRRNFICGISSTHDLKSKKSLPHITYLNEEKQIWNALFEDLVSNQSKCAPKIISDNFKIMSKRLGLNSKEIP